MLDYVGVNVQGKILLPHCLKVPLHPRHFPCYIRDYSLLYQQVTLSTFTDIGGNFPWLFLAVLFTRQNTHNSRRHRTYEMTLQSRVRFTMPTLNTVSKMTDLICGSGKKTFSLFNE